MKRRRKDNATFTEANVTPLADVVTTLIVVFLMTMPALMWSGIQVAATKASASSTVVAPEEKTAVDKLTVVVTPDGIEVDGRSVDRDELAELTREKMSGSTDRTAIIVPDDRVLLGGVVTVMDILKQNGAVNLALLNRVEGP